MQQKRKQPDRFVDVTPFLGLTQRQVADGFGVPDSTFSKRWKEATDPERTWPHRTITHEDGLIVAFLRNLPLDDSAPIALTEREEALLVASIRKRNCLFRPPVVLRLPPPRSSFVES